MVAYENKNKISVIVPVYNMENYIRKCLDSILEQTFKEFELIIVDDGSTDESPDICDLYEQTDQRIHVIHQCNKGLSEARNKGIEWTVENTDCKWITFIDSDDYVQDDYLQILYKLVCAFNVRCSIAGFSYVHNYLDEEKSNVAKIMSMTPDDAFGYYSASTDPDFSLTSAWSKLFHVDLFEEVRFPPGRIMEDRFTTHRLLFQCNTVAIYTGHLYRYYQSPNSIIRSEWNPKKMDDFDAFEEQLDFFRENGYHQAFIKTAREYIVELKKPLNPDIMPARYKKKYFRLIRKHFKTALAEYRKPLKMGWIEYAKYYWVALPRPVYCLVKIVLRK